MNAYFARVSLQQLVPIEGNGERAFVDTWDLDSLGTVGAGNLPQVQGVVLQIVDAYRPVAPRCVADAHVEVADELRAAERHAPFPQAGLDGGLDAVPGRPAASASRARSSTKTLTSRRPRGSVGEGDDPGPLRSALRTRGGAGDRGGRGGVPHPHPRAAGALP